MACWEWHLLPILQSESTEMEKGGDLLQGNTGVTSHLTLGPEEKQRWNLLALDNQSLGSLAVNPNVQAGGFGAEPAFPTEERCAVLCHTKGYEG